MYLYNKKEGRGSGTRRGKTNLDQNKEGAPRNRYSFGAARGGAGGGGSSLLLTQSHGPPREWTVKDSRRGKL